MSDKPKPIKPREVDLKDLGLDDPIKPVREHSEPPRQSNTQQPPSIPIGRQFASDTLSGEATFDREKSPNQRSASEHIQIPSQQIPVPSKQMGIPTWAGVSEIVIGLLLIVYFSTYYETTIQLEDTFDGNLRVDGEWIHNTGLQQNRLFGFIFGIANWTTGTLILAIDAISRRR